MRKSRNTSRHADARVDDNLVDRRRNIGHLNKSESHSSSVKPTHEKNESNISVRSKKSGWSTKEFKFENSYLTEAFKDLDKRCMRHVCYVVWIMWMVRLIVINYSSNEPFHIPGIATLLVACHGMQYYFLSHVIFLISAAIVFVGFQMWYWARTMLSKPLRKIFDRLCGASMTVYMTALLIVPWWWILAISNQGVIAKEFVVGEHVRIYMKIVSFLSEKINLALQESSLETKNKSALRSSSLFKFVYFLYAPTLIYRDDYPRKEKIRWSFALEHLAQLLFIFYTGFVVYETELQPSISSYLLKERPRSFLLLILQNSLPFCVMLVMGIIALWHSMQNFFAEILRFGDRRFYSDWWNEGTAAGFHRANNIVVQDWLFYYIYYPVRKQTGSKIAAQLAVLMLSGAVHDIMLGLALGFLFPLVTFNFIITAINLWFFKNEKRRDAFSNFSNLFFFPSGASTMGCFLAVEHLARQECQKVIDSSWDYFYPRFLECTVNKELS